eukprot:GHVP01070494.1.p1 GENE.GHVP01070494.1~~GHVP01070494.1.p1  ORF type:complete len:381 (+),score=77.95 GHVP01070494.1:24-1166(+)
MGLNMNLRACIPAGLSAAIQTTDSPDGSLNKKIQEIVATEEQIRKLETQVGNVLFINATKRIRFLITVEKEQNSFTLKFEAEGALDESERCMCPIYCLFSRINFQLGDTSVLFDREVLLNDEDCSPILKWSCDEMENLPVDDGCLPNCFCVACGCSTSTTNLQNLFVQRTLEIKRSLEDRDVSIQMFPNYQVPSFQMSDSLAKIIAKEDPDGVYSIAEIGKRFLRVIKDNRWHSPSKENNEIEIVHREPGLMSITDTDFEISRTSDVLKRHLHFPDATEVKFMITDNTKPQRGEINLSWVKHRRLDSETDLFKSQVETLTELEKTVSDLTFLKTLSTDPLAALEEVKEEEEESGPPRNFKKHQKKASFYRQAWVKTTLPE